MSNRPANSRSVELDESKAMVVSKRGKNRHGKNAREEGPAGTATGKSQKAPLLEFGTSLFPQADREKESTLAWKSARVSVGRAGAVVVGRSSFRWRWVGFYASDTMSQLHAEAS